MYARGNTIAVPAASHRQFAEGLTISGGGERGWAHDKKDSARLVLIRAARMQHAGPVFRAQRDSFPSGNRELFFRWRVPYTLEGNHRRKNNDIITT